jgi:hypothetical protein
MHCTTFDDYAWLARAWTRSPNVHCPTSSITALNDVDFFWTNFTFTNVRIIVRVGKKHGKCEIYGKIKRKKRDRRDNRDKTWNFKEWFLDHFKGAGVDTPSLPEKRALSHLSPLSFIGVLFHFSLLFPLFRYRFLSQPLSSIGQVLEGVATW